MFRQIIKGENRSVHRDRAISFLERLDLDNGLAYEVTVKLHKKSKTQEQLGYYWGVVMKIACQELGELEPEALDKNLRETVLTPEVKMGLTGEVLTYKRISQMNVKEMSEYIDMVIVLLSDYGVLVPPPHYRSL